MNTEAKAVDPNREVLDAVNTLREEWESKSGDLGKVARLEATIETFEKKVQTQEAEKKELERKQAEFEEKLENFQRAQSRMANGAGGNEITLEQKAFRDFIIRGDKFLNQDEVKALQSRNDPDGGYLVPVDRSNEILKNMTEISPIRQLARVRTTSRNEVQIPVRTGIPTAYWAGENDSSATNHTGQSSYGLEKMFVHKMDTTVSITREQLADAAFDMQTEIFGDVEESFAQKEGNGFVVGSGSGRNQPEGFLVNTSVGYYAQGEASSLTNGDAILAIVGEVKTGYNLTYLANRKTLAKVRILKNSNGQYLWSPGEIGEGLSAGRANTIAGLPYLECPDMPDIGANAYPIAIGDWKRGYQIVDNRTMEMIRDDFTNARQQLVNFTFFKRTGGQVTLPEAIKKLKIATS